MEKFLIEVIYETRRSEGSRSSKVRKVLVLVNARSENDAHVRAQEYALVMCSPGAMGTVTTALGSIHIPFEESKWDDDDYEDAKS